MKEEQLNRIERKLNYLILVSARDNFWKMFDRGDGKYKGWNALSVYEDLIEQEGNEDYLKPPK